MPGESPHCRGRHQTGAAFPGRHQKYAEIHQRVRDQTIQHVFRPRRTSTEQRLPLLFAWDASEQTPRRQRCWNTDEQRTHMQSPGVAAQRSLIPLKRRHVRRDAQGESHRRQHSEANRPRLSSTGGRLHPGIPFPIIAKPAHPAKGYPWYRRLLHKHVKIPPIR
jgi:hypothetical protein